MTWSNAVVRNRALDGIRVRARRRENALPESPASGDANGGHLDSSAHDALVTSSALKVFD